MCCVHEVKSSPSRGIIFNYDDVNWYISKAWGKKNREKKTYVVVDGDEKADVAPSFIDARLMDRLLILGEEKS